MCSRVPISIHALQAESDDQKFANSSALLISIHALQAESDNDKIQIYHVVFLFQSTLSKRRATEIQVLFLGLLHYFNPRSPSGERQLSTLKLTRNFYFNPRSPSGERPDFAYLCVPEFQFQSTLSKRRATAKICIFFPNNP